MHDYTAISRIADVVARVAAAHPITGVTVAIGPEAEPDFVRSALRDALSGTRGSTIDVACVDAYDTLACVECGREFPGAKLDRCPRCGGDALVIDAADAVTLARLAFVDPEVAGSS